MPEFSNQLIDTGRAHGSAAASFLNVNGYVFTEMGWGPPRFRYAAVGSKDRSIEPREAPASVWRAGCKWEKKRQSCPAAPAWAYRYQVFGGLISYRCHRHVYDLCLSTIYTRSSLPTTLWALTLRNMQWIIDLSQMGEVLPCRRARRGKGNYPFGQ